MSFGFAQMRMRNGEMVKLSRHSNSENVHGGRQTAEDRADRQHEGGEEEKEMHLEESESAGGQIFGLRSHDRVCVGTEERKKKMGCVASTLRAGVCDKVFGDRVTAHEQR